MYCYLLYVTIIVFAVLSTGTVPEHEIEETAEETEKGQI
jgi:hypothetical protein